VHVTVRAALVVAAHPDDEALGCGGTIARLAAEGTEVHLLFLADGVSSRTGVGSHAPGVAGRRAMGDRAAAILGAAPPVYLDLPDNRMDGLDLLDVIGAIEEHAERLQPDVVFTSFAGDLNVDHRACAHAVTTAFRPTAGQSVRAVYSFEIASSTEWAFGVTGQVFTPTYFVDVEGFLPQKLAALEAYAEELRPFPHPRSPEAVSALARLRGSTVGVAAAEAFVPLRVLV
jgi:LmbE family N-acetylglucosaminyl deacetylase